MDYHNKKIDNQLFIKPDYLIHPFVSGNKFRKLKYNLLEAKKLGKNTLLTFGGAYSNHIAAVAAAGCELNLKTIGIIRGEELATKIDSNPTLKLAKLNGMHLKFVSREAYRQKSDGAYIDQLKLDFGDFYLLPEGGTNALAVKGCEEIITEDERIFDYICCSVGTGGTIAGIINGAFSHQKIIGFPALKGDFLTQEITKFAKGNNWQLISDYHFGGYAKVTKELIQFMNAFKDKYNIPLDPIYTGKMVFGVYDLMKQNYFPKEAKILMIHTGGLQGIEGMNVKLKQQNLPEIV